MNKETFSESGEKLTIIEKAQKALEVFRRNRKKKEQPTNKERLLIELLLSSGVTIIPSEQLVALFEGEMPEEQLWVELGRLRKDLETIYTGDEVLEIEQIRGYRVILKRKEVLDKTAPSEN